MQEEEFKTGHTVRLWLVLVAPPPSLFALLNTDFPLQCHTVNIGLSFDILVDVSQEQLYNVITNSSQY